MTLARADGPDAMGTNTCTTTYFAVALSHMRPLSEKETDMIERWQRRHGGSSRQWTAQHDRELRACRARGWTAAKIATKIGRTVESVRSRLRTLKRKERVNG